MGNLTLGDLAHSLVLRREAAALKTESRQLGIEVATGRAADTAQRVAGDLVPLAAIETSRTRAAGFLTANADAALTVQGMQAVLARVDGVAQGLSSSLLTASSTAHATMLDAAATEAAQAFDSAVAALNTRLGDRTLFAGVETGLPALAGGTAMLDAIATAAAGAATAADVAAAVGAWFDDPAGFGAAYQGGAATGALPLSPEDRLVMDVTAADPAIRNSLEALALGALLHRGLPAGPHAERAALARLSGEALVQTQGDRAGLVARLGTAEATIDRARQRNTAEIAALDLARADLLAVDGYAAASRLEAVQTQLETLHAVTARLSRLSLVDFLR